jgi:hypothetical protein
MASIFSVEAGGKLMCRYRSLLTILVGPILEIFLIIQLTKVFPF